MFEVILLEWAISSKVGGLNSKLKNIDSCGVEKKISLLHEEKKRLNSRLTCFKKDANNGEINSLKHQLRNLDTDVSTLEGHLERMKERRGKVLSQITSAKQDQSILKTYKLIAKAGK